MYQKQIFFLFPLYFLFFCCTNNTPSITQKNLINNNNDSLIKEQESHVEKIYFNVPSTMRTAYILKKAGANYDASLPLDPSIATEDFISDQQALILGILGSDLNYTIVSNKNQETVFYLNSINVLGEKLDLCLESKYDGATQCGTTHYLYMSMIQNIIHRQHGR